MKKFIVFIFLLIIKYHIYSQFNDTITFPFNFSQTDISCIGENHCYIVGINPTTVLKTIDGKSWENITGNLPYQTLTKIKCFDENKCIISSSNGLIYKTSNGGNSWELITQNGGRDAIFLNENDGYSYHNNNTLKTTSDGGYTWENIPTLLPGNLKNKVFFYSKNFGFLISESLWAPSNLFKTNDGGITWVNVLENQSFDGFNFVYSLDYDIEILNENTVYFIASENTLLKSEDGGNTWTKILIAKKKEPYQNCNIEFINECAGYILSGDGTIYRTNNGGETWEINELNFAYSNELLFFLNEKNAAYIIVDLPNNRDGIRNVNPKLFCSKSYPNQLLEVELFPIPVSNELHVKLNYFEEKMRVAITNQFGQKIFENEITSDELKIDVTNFTNGVYFFHCITDSGTITNTKIIIQ